MTKIESVLIWEFSRPYLFNCPRPFSDDYQEAEKEGFIKFDEPSGHYWLTKTGLAKVIELINRPEFIHRTMREVYELQKQQRQKEILESGKGAPYHAGL